MNAIAELIEDAGEAAVSEEFFRSRPFLDAEGVTHTLRITTDEGQLLAPLIVRDIPGLGGAPQGGESSGAALRDAVSPYGYPGVTVASDFEPPIGGKSPETRKSDASGPATSELAGLDPPARASARPGAWPPLDPATIDFSATGLVSIFIRHSLAPVPLQAASSRNVVQIADPSLPLKTRGSDRNQINKNRRAGYEVRRVPGAEANADERIGFLAAYEQTMYRTGASERYFFGAEYFDRLLESDRSWLALAHAPGGEVAAASIAVESDGFIHYYLSGSSDEHLRDSPMKNVVADLVELASEQGLPLNLGGGILRGDRLEEFKRGFANREEAWSTSEIVCDADAYARLSPPGNTGDYFPAYRAPKAANSD